MKLRISCFLKNKSSLPGKMNTAQQDERSREALHAPHSPQPTFQGTRWGLGSGKLGCMVFSHSIHDGITHFISSNLSRKLLEANICNQFTFELSLWQPWIQVSSCGARPSGDRAPFMRSAWGWNGQLKRGDRPLTRALQSPGLLSESKCSQSLERRKNVLINPR